MARHIEKCVPKKGNNPSPRLIRYADDFVILHPELDKVLKAKEAIQKWLEPVGLELKPEKTRICHTLNPLRVEESELTESPGFDFLGFNIRQYHVGRHKSGKSGGPKSTLLGFKTIIKPSKKSILAHHNALKRVIRTHQTAPQSGLIGKINPIIKGWCNYYSGVAAKETFSRRIIYFGKSSEHGLEEDVAKPISRSYPNTSEMADMVNGHSLQRMD
jgi:RNA-directed DNA polymerase